MYFYDFKDDNFKSFVVYNGVIVIIHLLHSLIYSLI